MSNSKPVNASKRITIRLPEETETAIRKLALQNNRSVSTQLRILISQSLSQNIYQENEEKILDNIQSAVDRSMRNYTERIAAISSKASISSATSMLLVNFLLHRISKADDIDKLNIFLHEIYLHAIKYVKTKESGLESFLMNSNEQLEKAWAKK